MFYISKFKTCLISILCLVLMLSVSVKNAYSMDQPPVYTEVGSISGIVTDKDDKPFYNCYVKVRVYNSNGGFYTPGAWTDTEGRYTINNVPPGEYRVSFEADKGQMTNYLNQWYPGVSSYEEASWVSVYSWQDTEGINAKLQLGGSISGTVWASHNEPLSNVSVWIYTEDGRLENGTSTNFDGRYRVVLPSGKYYLKFNPLFYEEKTIKDLTHATPLLLSPGQDSTVDVNFKNKVFNYYKKTNGENLLDLKLKN